MAKTYRHEVRPGEWVEIIPGPNGHVRLFGVLPGQRGSADPPRVYERIFKVGDWCEFDSYNLSYLGRITKLTPKTIFVKPRYRGEETIVRMKPYHFQWRNWDFDFDKTEKENHFTSLTI